MSAEQPMWQAPMTVSNNDPFVAGVVRRAETFLRALFDPASRVQPLPRLKDLELYLRTLPNQGPYFADAVRATVEPPSIMPTVQATILGPRMSIKDADTDTSRQEVEDEREWQEEWRESASGAISAFWELIAEAIMMNQKLSP
jgi:hypothetical protein